MKQNNRVIWSEGMFLRPHHYQQYTRYFENLLDQRASGLRAFGWGFRQLEIDQPSLALGKILLNRAAGVFPDGTPFHMPQDDRVPSALEVPSDRKDTIVYLGVPLRRPGQAELEQGRDLHSLARYSPAEQEISDTTSLGGTPAVVQLGELRTRLMLDGENRDDFACLGIARILERRNDGSLALDPEYIPSVLDVHAAPALLSLANEIVGLVKHRVEALALRVGQPNHAGSAEIADFLMLQTVNRWLPVLADLAGVRGGHPSDLYRVLLSLTGDLAVFARADRKTRSFDPFRHEDLQATFRPVIQALRSDLSLVLEQKAVPIPLNERKYGVRVASINDRALFASAQFVLAVRADMATEELRSRVPPQIKIGPVEQIRQLVNAQLPGIRVRPLPVAPRQISYHAGSVYFELEQNSDLWQALANSGGLAIHLAGEFPGIAMELWAIRN